MCNNEIEKIINSMYAKYKVSEESHLNTQMHRVISMLALKMFLDGDFTIAGRELSCKEILMKYGIDIVGVEDVLDGSIILIQYKDKIKVYNQDFFTYLTYKDGFLEHWALENDVFSNLSVVLRLPILEVEVMKLQKRHAIFLNEYVNEKWLFLKPVISRIDDKYNNYENIELLLKDLSRKSLEKGKFLDDYINSDFIIDNLKEIIDSFVSNSEEYHKSVLSKYKFASSIKNDVFAEDKIILKFDSFLHWLILKQKFINNYIEKEWEEASRYRLNKIQSEEVKNIAKTIIEYNYKIGDKVEIICGGKKFSNTFLENMDNMFTYSIAPEKCFIGEVPIMGYRFILLNNENTQFLSSKIVMDIDGLHLSPITFMVNGDLKYSLTLDDIKKFKSMSEYI